MLSKCGVFKKCYWSPVVDWTQGPGFKGYWVVLPKEPSFQWLNGCFSLHLCLLHTCISLNCCMCRIVKIHSMVLKDTAFVLSRLHFDWCRHSWDAELWNLTLTGVNVVQHDIHGKKAQFTHHTVYSWANSWLNDDCFKSIVCQCRQSYKKVTEVLK